MFVVAVISTILLIVAFIAHRKLKKNNQSVDSILRDITQKIEDLHAVKEAKHLESEAHAALVEDYKKLQSAALQEKVRAETVAEKLTGLIS